MSPEKALKAPLLVPGKASGEVSLSSAVFAAETKPHLLHQTVRAELAAARQGTRGSKRRGMVAGGRSKPWRQKGTGRARAGTTRAPQWTGGGVAFAPVMRKTGGGSIVNIASISGLRASTLRVAYGTSKAALIHLTKQQAVELGHVGIRVNAIAPGPVDTEMAKLVHSVAIRSDYYDAIPLNRYGTTEEIASVAGFLCSSAASFVTGQVLAVDGGFDAAGVGLPTLRKRDAA